jgi:hypothetical protein
MIKIYIIFYYKNFYFNLDLSELDYFFRIEY